jgi:large subunit ribosomal protein L10
MAKTKQQKADILEKLTSIFKDSAATVFVHFKGLGVADETAMRHKLEDDGVNYFVAKKTLMRKAAEAAGIAGELPSLEGEIAVAYGQDDPTAPARGVHGFAKEYGAEHLAIAGGIYEGGILDALGMQEIATIPPLEVLRGMFANVINSPIQGLAVALGQVSANKEA